MKLCDQDPVHLDVNLAAWLFTVCRNRALDVRRKEQRMTALTDQTAEDCASREPTVEPSATMAEETGQVQRCMGQLPLNQQEVLRLKIQNGLSYREISEITGLSVSNVGYLLHTAIKRIREKLAE